MHFMYLHTSVMPSTLIKTILLSYLLQAVCCSDLLHCCPHDYVCDVTHQTCVTSDGSSVMAQKTNTALSPLRENSMKNVHVMDSTYFKIPLMTKVPARNFDGLSVGMIVCPDKQSMCYDGQTCCILASGGYGCCPLPNVRGAYWFLFTVHN